MTTTPNPTEPDTARAGAEPAGWTLDRLEAATRLWEPCRHCKAVTAPAAAWNGGSIPTALGVTHEPGCPDNPPEPAAAIVQPNLDDPRIPPL